MVTLVQMINGIIGIVPAGWEFVPYLAAVMCFFLGLWLVWKVVSIPFWWLRGGGE